MSVQVVEYVPAPTVGVAVAAPARRHLRVVGADERATSSRLYLTRRGRLVRTLFIFGLASLAALLLWSRLTSTAPATHAVTVESGQSLSQIAAEELPDVPVETAVLRIQVANDLRDSTILTGQQLVIPGRA